MPLSGRSAACGDRLSFRTLAGGSRNWVFQYALGTKQRRLSLGTATPESFAKQKGPDGTIKLGIREQAALLHAAVKLGQDPAGEKTESRKRASDTFEAIAKKYLAAKKASTRPGTYREIERHIVQYAKPLNGLQVARDSGAQTIGLTGFTGGKMRILCDLCIVIPSDSMQLIEDFHVAVTHSIFVTLRHKIFNEVKCPSE